MTPFERRKAEVLERIHGPKPPKGSAKFLLLRELVACLFIFSMGGCFSFLIGLTFFEIFGPPLSRGGGFSLIIFSGIPGFFLDGWIAYLLVLSTKLLTKKQLSNLEFRLGKWGIFGFFKKWEEKKITRHPFKN